jgi:hypothetical protein
MTTSCVCVSLPCGVIITAHINQRQEGPMNPAVSLRIRTCFESFIWEIVKIIREEWRDLSTLRHAVKSNLLPSLQSDLMSFLHQVLPQWLATRCRSSLEPNYSAKAHDALDA